tara:strand:+ start:1126 stop:1428 length:303 start_codon:yes stop_codon:yes gene_type:complete
MSERTPERIRDTAIDLFIDRANAKFNAGQEEHGGNLDERVTFKDIEDEIIDLWFYVQSKKRGYERKQVELKKALSRITLLKNELDAEKKATEYYKELSKR